MNITILHEHLVKGKDLPCGRNDSIVNYSTHCRSKCGHAAKFLNYDKDEKLKETISDQNKGDWNENAV